LVPDTHANGTEPQVRKENNQAVTTDCDMVSERLSAVCIDTAYCLVAIAIYGRNDGAFTWAHDEGIKNTVPLKAAREDARCSHSKAVQANEIARIALRCHPVMMVEKCRRSPVETSKPSGFERPSEIGRRRSIVTPRERQRRD
jgi:hypothetical protein